MRFWNRSITHSASDLLKDVMKSDIELSVTNKNCWTAHLLKGIESLACPGFSPQSHTDRVSNFNLVDGGGILKAVTIKYEAYWGKLVQTDIRKPDTANRKLSTYATYFAQPNVFPKAPDYFSGVHTSAKLNAQFRLGSHRLGVETGRWTRPYTDWADRICTRCSDTYKSNLPCAVDDEYHLAFECEYFDAERADISDLIDMAEKSVPKLLSRYDELEKRQRIYKFTTACMNKIHRRTEQPEQAEGQL